MIVQGQCTYNVPATTLPTWDPTMGPRLDPFTSGSCFILFCSGMCPTLLVAGKGQCEITADGYTICHVFLTSTFLAGKNSDFVPGIEDIPGKDGSEQLKICLPSFAGLCHYTLD